VNEDKFSDEFYERWERLISQVEIVDVPLRFIGQIAVFFKNGDNTIFDVTAMITGGANTEQIEEMIETYLFEYDKKIDRVDFHINIQSVASEVATQTTKLLD
jgi:hypothetical protein